MEEDKKNKNIDVVLNEVNLKLQYVVRDVTEIKQNLKATYVTKTEFDNMKEAVNELKEGAVRKSDFDPVKKIVYGLIGVIGSTIVVSIMGLLSK
jgi:prefoldin subunit 5